MSSRPSWLPEIVSIDGEWDLTLKMLYRIFETDIKNGGLTFYSHVIWWDKRIEEDDKYEEGFWHLIGRTDHETNERLIDSRRAERLPWFAPTIRNKHTPEVCVFEYLEGNGKTNTYVWIKDHDYLIILFKKQLTHYSVYFLRTAYHIDGDSKRKKLRRKFEKRVV